MHAFLPSEGHHCGAVKVDDCVASTRQGLQAHPRDELVKCSDARIRDLGERRREHLADRPTGEAEELQQHGIAPQRFDVGEAVFPHKRRHHEGEEDEMAGVDATEAIPWSDPEQRLPDVELLFDESNEGHDSRE